MPFNLLGEIFGGDKSPQPNPNYKAELYDPNNPATWPYQKPSFATRMFYDEVADEINRRNLDQYNKTIGLQGDVGAKAAVGEEIKDVLPDTPRRIVAKDMFGGMPGINAETEATALAKAGFPAKRAANTVLGETTRGTILENDARQIGTRLNTSNLQDSIDLGNAKFSLDQQGAKQNLEKATTDLGTRRTLAAIQAQPVEAQLNHEKLTNELARETGVTPRQIELEMLEAEGNLGRMTTVQKYKDLLAAKGLTTEEIDYRLSQIDKNMLPTLEAGRAAANTMNAFKGQIMPVSVPRVMRPSADGKSLETVDLPYISPESMENDRLMKSLTPAGTLKSGAKINGAVPMHGERGAISIFPKSAPTTATGTDTRDFTIAGKASQPAVIEEPMVNEDQFASFINQHRDKATAAWNSIAEDMVSVMGLNEDSYHYGGSRFTKNPASVIAAAMRGENSENITKKEVWDAFNMLPPERKSQILNKAMKSVQKLLPKERSAVASLSR